MVFDFQKSMEMIARSSDATVFFTKIAYYHRRVHNARVFSDPLHILIEVVYGTRLQLPNWLPFARFDTGIG